MIKLSHLRKTYPGGVTALDDVSLEVPPGEIFGVIGRSGAGKSTLLRTVNLLERPDGGTVEVAGAELTAQSARELRHTRRRIGMIFQHFNLLSGRTVAGNVSLPLEIAGNKPTKARIGELLELVGLADKAHAYPGQLSGGQRQRVAIARALANDPVVLLSDEATSALDPHTTVEVLDLLKDLNRRLGLTVLLITHDLGVVTRICDRVGVIQDGRLVEVTRVDQPGPAFEALRQAVAA